MTRTALIGVLAGSVALLGGIAPTAMAKGGQDDPRPLSSEPVPRPPDIDSYVKDHGAAVRLGKALFWDMQAGSDGRTACASCHFNAGADNRSRNTMSPRGGDLDLKAANAQLAESDFPLRKLADPNDAASAVIADTDDVVGSQGVTPSTFVDIVDGDAFDGQVFSSTDSDFHVGGTNVRRVTGRNTPSAINAVFNDRNFWDGRAQNEFNGVNPFGLRDPGARIGRVGSGGIEQVPVTIRNASLASQAVGPPGNDVEMSAAGRTLSDIGRKLLALRPLGTQAVSGSDSVLGSEVAGSGRGLRGDYRDMVEQAFHSDLWDSSDRVTAPNGKSYSLMQFNFPLFWGLAIQEYESTLVSDQAPLDRFLTGDTSALSASAQAGMGIFTGKGGCADCHTGALLSSATVSSVQALGTAAGGADTGFFNIGVRPTAADPGLGGTDPFGASLARTATAGAQGAFKTPSLRNVELTAPYFHNGGQLTLGQVVDFYSRGGDFNNPQKSGEITNLGLSAAEKADLVAFLQSLTDPRVRNQAGPFDHPELFVPLGSQTDSAGNVLTDGSGHGVDCFVKLAATGSGGGSALPPFPGLTGPPCDTPPALPHAVKNSGPGSSGGGGGGAGPGGGSRPAPITAASRRRRCVVPRLTGRSIGTSKRLLLRANCRLGLVSPRQYRRVKSRRLDRYVVRRQSIRPRAVRRSGTRVNVTVRRPRH